MSYVRQMPVALIIPLTQTVKHRWAIISKRSSYRADLGLYGVDIHS